MRAQFPDYDLFLVSLDGIVIDSAIFGEAMADAGGTPGHPSDDMLLDDGDHALTLFDSVLAHRVLLPTHIMVENLPVLDLLCFLGHF